VRLHPWLLGLVTLAIIQAVGTLRTFAQAAPRVDLPAVLPGANGDGWILLASSAIASVGTVLSVWINSRERAERQLREAAEKEMIEMTGRFKTEFDALETELKAAQAEVKVATAERDQWMRRAYSRGWHSSDSIPTRKDPP
jgi:hypothetical protein